MTIKVILSAFILFLICRNVRAQDSIPELTQPVNDKAASINGFIRGGGYYDINRSGSDPFLSAIYSDLGLKFEAQKQGIYKAFADVRLRYGSEFGKPVKTIDLREAYVDYSGRHWKVSMGQKILKWGRADFTNPTSKFNPQNLITRSPDREDMDLGNIITSLNIFPSDVIDIQAVIAPFYRPSVLIIEPVPLPENTYIDQIDGLITDQQMLSYGLRADFHLKGIDWGISYFNGYDPMPGIALTGFTLDLSTGVPVSTTNLSIKPYRTQVYGVDFETAIGPLGVRGEAAWSVPFLSYKTNEYVPMDEVKWVAGLDWAPGKFRFTAEYTGKYLPAFEPAMADPIIGTEPDYAKLAELLATPGFDINEYVRQQVSSFNRLYNYQLEEFYHSAGLRIEAELLYGRLVPSLFSLYNFTSKDLMIIPEIRFKPSDGLTIVCGSELYYGIKSSLFDIVDDFMNTIYLGIKVDF